jgi:hypothetical protein
VKALSLYLFECDCVQMHSMMNSMARPHGPVPGPMPEEDMAKMCDTAPAGDDDDAVYPDVDDILELKVGTIVFVTVKLTKASDANELEVMDYALPGMTYTDVEGKLAVKPYPTKLWAQGWTEIENVRCEDAIRLRFCSRAEEMDEDQLIIHFYEDDIGEVVESCGDAMLKDSTNFKRWMGGAIGDET